MIRRYRVIITNSFLGRSIQPAYYHWFGPQSVASPVPIIETGGIFPNLSSLFGPQCMNQVWHTVPIPLHISQNSTHLPLTLHLNRGHSTRSRSGSRIVSESGAVRYGVFWRVRRQLTFTSHLRSISRTGSSPLGLSMGHVRSGSVPDQRSIPSW